MFPAQAKSSRDVLNRPVVALILPLTVAVQI
jgi:hypothetical protein